MATERQLIANRGNALRSTGPRSAEGKARASRNATTHGIFSSQVLLAGEDERLFSELRDGLYGRLRPADELERLLADRVVVYAWKLRRVLDAEALVYAELAEPWRPRPAAKKVLARHLGEGRLDNLSRYEVTLERAMYKALAELRRAQAERAKAGEEQVEEEDAPLQNEPNPSGTGVPHVHLHEDGQEPLSRREHVRDAHATLRNEANSPPSADDAEGLPVAADASPRGEVTQKPADSHPPLPAEVAGVRRRPVPRSGYLRLHPPAILMP